MMTTDTAKLELYWNDIPVGRENAIDYNGLVMLWGFNQRTCRRILHDLSAYDNGDDYILIRSARNKGFYRSNEPSEMKAYRHECLNKGKALFVPLKKIGRVLDCNAEQYSITNNLRLYREERGLKQGEVCQQMQTFDAAFNIPMLSKMENGICLPTPMQLVLLSGIYGCKTTELVKTNIYEVL